MLRQILALAFIFVCTTIAWLILGATISSRTDGATQQLQSHVASTWGMPQQQTPPTATFAVKESKTSTSRVDGREVVREEQAERQVPLALQASRIHVNIHLDPRKKGLLWYSTYAVNFTGDYVFHNDTSESRDVTFRLKFPADKAIYDGLQMTINDQTIPSFTDADGTVGRTTVSAQSNVKLHVAYRSQGLDSWRYQLGDGIAQARDFQLVMQTNFRNIDFADDTLSPTSKLLVPGGWQLTWSIPIWSQDFRSE